MATAGAHDVGCNLVRDRTLKLGDNPNRQYNSVVVTTDMVIVVDRRGCKLLLYKLIDGTLVAVSSSLQSSPFDVCFVDRTQVVVTRDDGNIDMFSVDCTSHPTALRLMGTLNVTQGFDSCHGVKVFRSGGKLAVSGMKRDQDNKKTLICWGIVSFVDGHIGTIHTICKGFWSYLATSPDDSVVYISCNSGDSHDTGVYAFDVRLGSKMFVYRRSELKYPRGISVDTVGYIYVCNNLNPPCIHQMTGRGEPLSVHKEGLPHQPWGIFWEGQQEGLYVTGVAGEIRKFRLKWSTQQGNHKASDFVSYHKASDVVMMDDGRQAVCLKSSTQMQQEPQKTNLNEEEYSKLSSLTLSEDRRPLPPGNKYHVFFSYSSSNIKWVKETVDRLEKDHGFVCCEYDRDNTPGTPLLKFVSNSIMDAYKTVVVLTPDSVQSDFVLHEIDMALTHGFEEHRSCVLPLLLEDCKIPLHLKVINYVDARREDWWSKLLYELEK